MLDFTTPRGAIIGAALRLAAERPWREVALADIAEAAGTTLPGLKKEFTSKADILAAFVAMVDDEVLERAPRRGPEQPARDALFEVVMSRFDVLAPHKAALRSVARDAVPEPALAGPMLASQRWMLEAAGIGTGGLEGTAKVLGLATVYASVLRTWLGDDDPGHSRTMAALDRRLRRGERTLDRVEAMCSGLTRFACAAMPRGFGGRQTSDAPQSPATEEPQPGPGPSI